MRISVLGPLEVLTDELAPVPVPGAKERLLLAVLAAGAPGVTSTDRLTEALWNGAAPVSSRKSLQAHLVRLRSALEPRRPRGSTGQYVVRRGAGYALAIGRADLDALHVSDLASQGRAQLAAGEPAEAERLLGAAVELWRGEPYADWSDAPFAEPERRRLHEVRSGALAGLLEARLELGRHADVVPELERMVAQEPLREDWWRLLVLALYRAGRQADALSAARRVRTLLIDELGSEPGPALREMELAVLAQEPALDLPSGRAPPPPGADRHHGSTASATSGGCPFKGLATYQVADAPLFYGRQRLVASLVARLVDSSVLVVSGPSGAGKSSAVRAGLLPAVAAGALPGSAGWQAVIVTPGARPVDALAGLTGESPPAAPVILVCDQFEELWAPAVASGERTAFLDAVLGLLDDDIVERCVLVVRGDHMGRLAEHAGFAARLGRALVLVPALTDPELREIVREPACAVDLAAESELLDAVVADVLGRTGALPLLSTALVGTWERRRGDLLTLAGYLAAGGVAGALTRSAESAFTALDEPAQKMARHVLVRLADADETGAVVRRPILLDELGLDGDLGEVRRQVLDVFVGRRLLTVDGERVEVAHEALLTAWPRLARWLEDDAAARDIRRRVTMAAHEWDLRGRTDDDLHRGARLVAGLDWISGLDADPTPLELEFLAASRQRAETELREAQEQFARERRARRRAHRLATGLAGVLVVALVAALLAVRFQRAADARATALERNAVLADAARLAALSGDARPLDVSLLLAAEGVRLADTPETEDALLGSLRTHQRAVATVTAGEPLLGSALGGNGTLFLMSDDSVFTWPVSAGAGRTEPPHRTLRWFGMADSAASPTDDLLVGAGVTLGAPGVDEMWVRLLPADGSDSRFLVAPGEVDGLPFGLSFTNDGRHVDVFSFLPPDAATGGEHVMWHVTEVDVADGASRTLAVSGTLAGTAPSPAADISRDGRTAVVYDALAPSAGAILVDLVDGHQVRLQVPPRRQDSIGFRSLVSGAAQLWADGAVTLYDAHGRPVQQVGQRPGPVLDVVVSPDDSWAATVGGGGAVTLWDLDARTGQWTERESFVGHAGDVVEAHATRDGRLLVTRGKDDRIIVWDVTSSAGFGSSVDAQGDWSLAGPPQVVGPRLVVAPTRSVSGAAEGGTPPPGTARLAATFLEPRTGKVVDQVDVGALESPRGAPGMAVSPNLRMVAISTGLVTTVVDTRTRVRRATIELPPDGSVGSDGRPRKTGVASCVAWTPDSSRLLLCTAGEDPRHTVQQLAMVSPEDGAVVRRVPLGGIVAEAISMSPDGRRLALAHLRAGLVLILDAAALRIERVVDVGAGGAATDISFSPDGRRIAVTGQSRDLLVLDTMTWESSREVIPVGSALLQAEWLADNRTVALGSSDGTFSLFDTVRWQLRTSPVSASNDGRAADVYLVPGLSGELVAISGRYAGRSWPMDPRIWVEQACALAGRDLSRSEWAQYLPDRPYGRTCSDVK